MKSWFKFIIVLIVCIVIVGGVYIWKFGLPAFLSREERYMKSIYSNLAIDNETIEVKLQDKSIVFNKEGEGRLETVQFNIENGVVSAVIYDSNTSEEFKNLAIKYVFLAAVKLNQQSEENAIYSLISDVIEDKELQKDGYSLTYQNNITRFNMKINEKFNLANGEDVYIKASDVEKVLDVIKYKLQSKIIEKPGIVLEKTVTYSNDLVYIIYEKERLTNRTYNSFISLITTLLKEQSDVDYVKANYPSITRAGTIKLKGITISLNEGIKEGNVHKYNMPEDYEYMVIRVDSKEVER